MKRLPASSLRTCDRLHRRATTLIELVVCLAIFVLMLALLLPAVQAAREAARQMACSNKIRSLTIALIAHHNRYHRLPAGTSTRDGSFKSWMVDILPEVEQSPLYDRIRADFAQAPSGFDPAVHQTLRSFLPVLACPSDVRNSRVQFCQNRLRFVGLTSYLGSAGTQSDKQDGVLYGGSTVAFRDITDGLSNTLMLVERPPTHAFDLGWWYAGTGTDRTGKLDHTMGVVDRVTPDDNATIAHCPPSPESRGGRDDNCDALYLWSYHRGGYHVSRCDGSVALVSSDRRSSLTWMASKDQGDSDPTNDRDGND